MISVMDILANISKGQAAIKTSSIKRDLESFYEKIRSKIKITYAKKEGPGTLLYFKLPASDYPLFYDVVLLVNTQTRILTTTLLKVYSNSPNFAFNYCFLFYKENSLLFPDKYPDIFLTTPPKVRNPLETKAFDKHIYACLKYISRIPIDEIPAQFEGNPEPEVMNFQAKMDHIKKVSQEMKDLKSVKH